MLALRLHGEEGVEGNDAIYPGDGDMQIGRDDLLYDLGQVAQQLLGGMENVDQLSGVVIAFRTDSVQFLDLFFR